MSTTDNIRLGQALAKFKELPGRTAYSFEELFYHGAGVPLMESWNQDQVMFCASAFKVLVVAAYLYYAERGELPPQRPGTAPPQNVAQALAEPLEVTAADHTQSSRVLGDLTGRIIANAVLDAMIGYSDNTATDIAMRRIGVDRIRAFMYGPAKIARDAVKIPDSTAAFLAYLHGGPNRYLINGYQSMLCTAAAMKRFYAQCLARGTSPVKLFQEEATRRHFERVMSVATSVTQLIPEGRFCCMKSGEADFDGEHALAVAGAAFLHTRTIGFTLLYGWDGADNYESGFQAYVAASKRVFDALEALPG